MRTIRLSERQKGPTKLQGLEVFFCSCSLAELW
jgi:hypothetical protein